jgi:hypothetical protein
MDANAAAGPRRTRWWPIELSEFATKSGGLLVRNRVGELPKASLAWGRGMPAVQAARLYCGQRYRRILLSCLYKARLARAGRTHLDGCPA